MYSNNFITLTIILHIKPIDTSLRQILTFACFLSDLKYKLPVDGIKKMMIYWNSSLSIFKKKFRTLRDKTIKIILKLTKM